MICEKCGHEFFEGRNCPECGALAIFVKEDEYQERRQEWEEENTPKEAVEKKKLNIHINPASVKKAVIFVAVVCVIATAAFGLVAAVVGFVKQEQYTIVYDMGNSMNADKGSFEVFSVESAVFSADGNYVYKDNFEKADIAGEVIAFCVSQSGKWGAIVTQVYEDTVEYNLYRIGTACEKVRTGTNSINIVDVADDGSVYYTEAETGAYDVVLETWIYVFDGNKSKVIAENVGDVKTCENQHELIYYDLDLKPYRYQDGKVELLYEEEGLEVIKTLEGALYYINNSNELYIDGAAQPADSEVVAGTLSAVANSGKVTYVKAGQLLCYGKGMKAPIVLVSEYDVYGEKAHVVEKHNKIYCAYNGKLKVMNKNGKIYSQKDGIEGVYLCK